MRKIYWKKEENVNNKNGFELGHRIRGSSKQAELENELGKNDVYFGHVSYQINIEKNEGTLLALDVYRCENSL